VTAEEAVATALQSLVTDPDADDLRDWLGDNAQRLIEYLCDDGYSIVPTADAETIGLPFVDRLLHALAAHKATDTEEATP
jgi:hypothetical protein